MKQPEKISEKMPVPGRGPATGEPKVAVPIKQAENISVETRTGGIVPGYPLDGIAVTLPGEIAQAAGIDSRQPIKISVIEGKTQIEVLGASELPHTEVTQKSVRDRWGLDKHPADDQPEDGVEGAT